MIMFGSFLPSLGWLAPPKFTRAWEPTLLWNHYTNNLVFGELQRRWRTGIRRNYCFGSFFNTHACLRQLSASKCSGGPVLFIWNCFRAARSRRNRQADKSDRIPAQLTARYWHDADSNASLHWQALRSMNPATHGRSFQANASAPIRQSPEHRPVQADQNHHPEAL